MNYSDNQDIDVRVESLVNQLSLSEKVSLLSGLNNWQTVPIERLNIPSITMTDGPHGVRANRIEPERRSGTATSFPTGVSMAATWNPQLIHQVGEALAEETLALGCEILLGPCVNIVRTPLAGRNFESYAEDPFLAGWIGTAWVSGLQSKGVGASLKHYACNNQEIERFRGNSIVDERTLREIYLAQFEMIVKEASPWTVMCSYNRINGSYASQNQHLLTEILKNEWGFQGAVVSDWGANHTTVESVQGGLDIEMPGPARYYGRFLEDAVNTWQIDLSAIDNAVRRILKMIILSGKMDNQTPTGSVNTPEHQHLARKLAEESITLLKNEGGLLPIDETIKSIAIIGPNAAECRIGGGGSSYLEPPYRISPLEALTTQLGDRIHIEYEQGCDNVVQLPALKSEYLMTPDGNHQGILGEYYNNTDFTGSPSVVRIDPKLDDWRIILPDSIHAAAFSIRWQGILKVPENGRYALQVESPARVNLYIDDKLLITTETLDERENGNKTLAYINLDTTKIYKLKVEYVKPKELRSTMLYVRALYAPDPDDRFDNAIMLAQKSDLVLFFGGMPTGWESEGRDRTHMRLTGNQDELITALAQVNENIVVVLNVGSPVEMPWVDQVKTIMLAYYPGQEGGYAVSNILTGIVNPSGKLTVTFPLKYKDNPTYIHYPGTKDVIYGEGLFVGYRYYDMKDISPLYPFGHGLSYTTFSYSDLHMPDRINQDETLEVSVAVTNTGHRAGKEVVQLYISDPASSLVRPPKELKGFQKVELQPGETKKVVFTIKERDLSFYNPYLPGWVAEPGEFEVLIGASSRDILLKKSFILN